MECLKCKKDPGNGKYCLFCGTELGVAPAPESVGDTKTGKVITCGCLVVVCLVLVGFLVLLTVLRQLETH